VRCSVENTSTSFCPSPPARAIIAPVGDQAAIEHLTSSAAGLLPCRGKQWGHIHVSHVRIYCGGEVQVPV
jgi:hypothetical protein